MEDVLRYPTLKEIGDKDRRKDFVHAIIDNLYLYFGKNMDATLQERDLAAKRFADKFPYCTIGDVVCFSDMILDGSITIEKNYLTLVSLFQAWHEYQCKRGDMIYEMEKKEIMSSTQDKSDITPEELNEVQKRIRNILGSLHGLWDEYIATRPKGWAPHYDKDGVNQEYARFRAQRMKAEGINEVPIEVEEKQTFVQPHYNLPSTDTQEDIF